MAQSSKYAKLDQDVLLEFIYHDQNVATITNYQIEIDDNGSHLLALNTTASTSDTRHLINELGANVVNFDVTLSAGYILIENFAARPLTLGNGKTYKFNVSTLPTPSDFKVIDASANQVGFLTGTTYTFTPTTNGSYSYEFLDHIGGKITVQNNANPLYATADEQTGNDIKTGTGQPNRYQSVLIDGVDSSKYALLDSTNNFINNNPEWTGSNSSTISQATAIDIPANTITYDTVRLHLRSGFSFAARGYEGFLFQIAAERLSGVKNFLTSIGYLNSSNFEIQNPKPFILGETMYSKFIEVKIPSLVGMDPDFNTWFFGAANDAVNPLANYEITYKLIDNIDGSTGFDYANTAEEVSFTLGREDDFGDIAAVIEEATDGDYFKLYGTVNGSITSFDAYINNRMDTSSDDITVFHDIAVYEQITTFFDKTYEMSITQVENFDEPIPFRPVVENSSNATAYNIDYTLRIYNETNNTQIVKRASFTSYDIGKYGKRLRTIDLPAGNKEYKIYNTLPNVLESRKVAENIASLPENQTRFVPTFIERMNIVTGSTSVNIAGNEVVDNSQIEYYADGKSKLILSPFDNYVKFKIAKLDGNNLISISLEGVDKVVLNLGDVPVDNSLNYADVELAEGEIMFKIKQSDIESARALKGKTYMLSIMNGTDKTLIHYGEFSIISGTGVIEKATDRVDITSSNNNIAL
tara:strand:+ start:179 stop:2269 length:2091 start_codon:yes stop_codon:yes gene_type:complete